MTGHVCARQTDLPRIGGYPWQFRWEQQPHAANERIRGERVGDASNPGPASSSTGKNRAPQRRQGLI
eukprot:12935334-Prorocentrum_lima.AAC.1